MVEKQVTVQLKPGLQARPAALFVQTANSFLSEVFLEYEGRKINAKSIMGIMSLAIGSGKSVTIYAEGSDEERAVEELSRFLEKEE
ncbi:HPr family phosphocarrier protein [Pallidibacillus pasinlerensis]|uniref:HPr family phosphocarrier protein n=1 Tax=Pallidibacillus pasinlerensis TaxID=2703818 RepID=A0ABX0A642_9BACI|nr:HPr family phosphocarrier protein [Pallidibacillus pasinlerensis]NCU17976.1 HPr family phosphocarrier protein [Pallidibacillus pasinlerensis]